MKLDFMLTRLQYSKNEYLAVFPALFLLLSALPPPPLPPYSYGGATVFSPSPVLLGEGFSTIFLLDWVLWLDIACLIQYVCIFYACHTFCFFRINSVPTPLSSCASTGWYTLKPSVLCYYYPAKVSNL